MNKINELTRCLLAEGCTPEATPLGMREYSPYDGGWTYDSQTLGMMVFETPCGLLAEGWHFRNGYLAYQGIDWRAEAQRSFGRSFRQRIRGVFAGS